MYIILSIKGLYKYCYKNLFFNTNSVQYLYNSSLDSNIYTNGVFKDLNDQVKYSGYFKYNINNLSFNFIKAFIIVVGILSNFLFFKIINNSKTNSIHLFEYLQIKVVCKYNYFNKIIFIINFFNLQNTYYKGFIKFILNTILSIISIILIIILILTL